MPKTPAFAVVRYDEYLADSTDDIALKITVVKVLLDPGEAQHESDRLNDVNGPQARYWVQSTRILTTE